MHITKDEARILAVAINDFMFECSDVRKVDGLFDKLENLERKLTCAGEDKRRKGRTSQNDWNDLLKRFANSK